MADPNRHYLYDPADIVCFGGVHPVAAVGPDGVATLWLLDLDHEHDGNDCCGSTLLAVHDELGPLAPIIAARVWQCNAPTLAGRPCRLRARAEWGGRCRHHRKVVR